jgi:hypothetical protein
VNVSNSRGLKIAIALVVLITAIEMTVIAGVPESRPSPQPVFGMCRVPHQEEAVSLPATGLVPLKHPLHAVPPPLNGLATATFALG